MRPLIVILLVAAALGAFYFAFTMGDTTSTDPGGIAPTQADVVTPEPADTTPDELAGLNGTEKREVEIVQPRVTDNPGDADLTNQLTGLIVDNKGAGIVEARVVLTRFGSMSFFFSDSDGPDRSQDRVVATDSEGRYTFNGVTPYDDYALKVRHPDYGPHEEGGIIIGEDDRVEEPRIVLRPGIELTGMVSDTAGNPVIGATILLGESALGVVTDEGPDIFKETTDNTGRYSFKNISNGNWTLTIMAAGYGRVTVQQLNVTGDVSVEKDITMQVASMIAGRVMAAGGDVLERAKVQAFSLTQRNQQTRSTSFTDEAGEFVLEDVPSGSYTLLVSAPGFRGERRQRIEAGDMGVLVELFALPTVSGQVFDAGTGKPLTKFTVRLREEMKNAPVAVPVQNTTVMVNDPEGRFEIACPKAGTFQVEASSPEFASCFSENFTIADGQNMPGIDVNMTIGGTIKGRVVNSNGEPVRGATVTTHDKDWTDDEFMRAIGDMYPTMATTRKAKTKKDGSFELSGLTPADYLLHITHSQYTEVMAPGYSVAEAGEAGEADAGDVTMASGATVKGTVYDPNGTALVGAMVSMQAEVLPGQTPISYRKKTDQNGSYVIKHVRPGTYFVNARRTAGATGTPFEHWQDQKQTNRKLGVSDGEVYDGVDFRLGESGR
ncbi:MAG: putative GH25 family protein [Planctomycetota bacterium]|jgi:uncharacterized GH25 family protein